MRLFLAVAMAVVACGLVGCHTAWYESEGGVTYVVDDVGARRLRPDVDMVELTRGAGRLMVTSMRQGLPPDEPILVSSFVDIDDLTQSSTFGRIVAEQVASNLAQQGYKVVEMKLRQEGIFIKERAGEFLLSRELQAISASHEASAVLVGTYAVAEDMVFVTCRLVLVEDSSVIAAHDFSVPIGPNVFRMLKQSSPVVR
ncbi:MAG: hypothetical protein HN742_13195 [Lentisphaerae bacterium]|jgi:TolB-like protein|nr:hypothetical protein [Lentisphaerota bacterium]MBT4818126.1 hypothetical protein [Lentisphaerota bacterium]MBT5608169.1 hypothetical protein [Lentisphaerota bacterium]MBT7058942.1 hypothetical protein [Lentisphaerota bacterium]MBT7842827.1 hypothetical protein [Lentisphaerota bacterium]